MADYNRNNYGSNESNYYGSGYDSSGYDSSYGYDDDLENNLDTRWMQR